MILFIGGNEIDTKGAKAIGTALIKNFTLTYLDISMRSSILLHFAYDIIHRRKWNW